MTDQLLSWSERKRLVGLVEIWCAENKCCLNPYNIITALNEMGLDLGCLLKEIEK
jgi:hypothetical protein